MSLAEQGSLLNIEPVTPASTPEEGHVAVDRETHEVVLRIRHDIYPGEDLFGTEEWKWRLAFGGVMVSKVDVIEPSTIIKSTPMPEETPDVD